MENQAKTDDAKVATMSEGEWKLRIEEQLRKLNESHASRRPGSEDGGLTQLRKAFDVIDGQVTGALYGKALDISKAMGFVTQYVVDSGGSHVRFSRRMQRAIAFVDDLEKTTLIADIRQAMAKGTLELDQQARVDLEAALVSYEQALPKVMRVFGMMKQYLAEYHPNLLPQPSQGHARG